LGEWAGMYQDPAGRWTEGGLRGAKEKVAGWGRHGRYGMVQERVIQIKQIINTGNINE